MRLMSVGLNAVPTWLKPFRILSNGEKFRATLARQMESGVTIDNYTCITNRNVAASTSVSLSRLIRRYGNQGKGFKNVVFSTSYADVVEWLSPDWVIFTDSRTLVVNATPCGGPAISVDWTVKDEDAINVSEDLVQAKQACQADEELSTPVNRNDFTDKVTEDFDFSFEGSVSFKLPKLDLSALPRDFKVGLLVGPSGSGKTSLLRKFGDIVEPRWEEGAAVIEHSCFGSVHEAQEVLAAGEAAPARTLHLSACRACLVASQLPRTSPASYLASVTSLCRFPSLSHSCCVRIRGGMLLPCQGKAAQPCKLA